MFSLQTFLSNIYNDRSDAALANIAQLSPADIDSHNPKVSFILDTTPNANPAKVKFRLVYIALLQHYMQRAALALLKQIPSLNTEEKIECLALASKFQYKLLFRLICGHLDNETIRLGFSKIIAKALKRKQHTEIEYLIQRYPSIPYFVLRLADLDQLQLMRRLGQVDIPPAILLGQYRKFSEDVILEILHKNPRLLFELREHGLQDYLHKKKSNKIGSILHFALYYQHPRVLELLLKLNFNIQKTFLMGHITGLVDGQRQKTPACYLVRDLKSWQMMLPLNEHKQQTTIDYCVAFIMGELNGSDSHYYRYLIANAEEKGFVKIIHRLSSRFLKYHKNAVEILESTLQNKDFITTLAIRLALQNSPYGALILKLALENHYSLLIKMIIAIPKHHTAQAFRLLATYSDHHYLESTIKQMVDNNEPVDEINILNRSLFAAALTDKLMLVIRTAQSKLLFNNSAFRNQVSMLKNPQIMLLCMELGMDFSPCVIRQMLAYTILVGDADNAQRLLATPDLKNYPRVRNWMTRHGTKLQNTIKPITQFKISRYMPTYGLGLTQQQYHYAQAYHANLTHYYLHKDEFNITDKHPVSGKTYFFNLTRLGMLRRQIAYLSDTKWARYFGQERGGPLETPDSCDYGPYFIKFHQSYYEPSHPNVEKLGYDVDDYNVVCKAKIKEVFADQSLPLTEYVINYKNLICWNHTGPKQLTHLRLIISQHMDKLLCLSVNVHDASSIALLVQEIGILHWLLAHATFCYRGSAALAETICAAYFMYHGIMPEISAAADCEALASASITDYSKEYGRFFNHLTPIQSENLEGFNLIRSYGI